MVDVHGYTFLNFRHFVKRRQFCVFLIASLGDESLLKRRSSFKRINLLLGKHRIHKRNGHKMNKDYRELNIE